MSARAQFGSLTAGASYALLGAKAVSSFVPQESVSTNGMSRLLSVTRGAWAVEARSGGTLLGNMGYVQAYPLTATAVRVCVCVSLRTVCANDRVTACK